MPNYEENKDENDEKKTCRFCLGDSICSDNPMLNPCKCSGSMKFVHFVCLRTWILNKVDATNENGLFKLKFEIQ